MKSIRDEIPAAQALSRELDPYVKNAQHWLSKNALPAFISGRSVLLMCAIPLVMYLFGRFAVWIYHGDALLFHELFLPTAAFGFLFFLFSLLLEGSLWLPAAFSVLQGVSNTVVACLHVYKNFQGGKGLQTARDEYLAFICAVFGALILFFVMRRLSYLSYAKQAKPVVIATESVMLLACVAALGLSVIFKARLNAGMISTALAFLMLLLQCFIMSMRIRITFPQKMLLFCANAFLVLFVSVCLDESGTALVACIASFVVLFVCSDRAEIRKSSKGWIVLFRVLLTLIVLLFLLVVVVYLLKRAGITNMTENSNGPPWFFSLSKEMQKKEYDGTMKRTLWRQFSRVMLWFRFDWFADSQWQYNQGYHSIAAGGWFGNETWLTIVNSHNDFIYPYIIGRMGIVTGAVILLLMLAVFLVIFLYVGKQKSMSPLLSLSVRMFAIYYFLSGIYMVLGSLDLVPMSGVPIPFLSSGGTALAVWTTAFLYISFCSMSPSKLSAIRNMAKSAKRKAREMTNSEED